MSLCAIPTWWKLPKIDKNDLFALALGGCVCATFCQIHHRLHDDHEHSHTHSAHSAHHTHDTHHTERDLHEHPRHLLTYHHEPADRRALRAFPPLNASASSIETQLTVSPHSAESHATPADPFAASASPKQDDKSTDIKVTDIKSTDIKSKTQSTDAQSTVKSADEKSLGNQQLNANLMEKPSPEMNALLTAYASSHVLPALHKSKETQRVETQRVDSSVPTVTTRDQIAATSIRGSTIPLPSAISWKGLGESKERTNSMFRLKDGLLTPVYLAPHAKNNIRDQVWAIPRGPDVSKLVDLPRSEIPTFAGLLPKLTLPAALREFQPQLPQLPQVPQVPQVPQGFINSRGKCDCGV